VKGSKGNPGSSLARIIDNNVFLSLYMNLGIVGKKIKYIVSYINNA